MRIVHDLAQAHPPSHSYVTIGAFDGVHRGHQQLITTMVKAAHATAAVALALTFDPHPAAVLSHTPPPLLLTTTEERAALLAAPGLDILVISPFTLATSRIPAADFVTALLQHLHMTELWAGPDFALGYRREGNIPFLQRLGAERGFTVRVVEPLLWEGAVVSSSRVRNALQAGDISQTTGCLGRPYRLSGLLAPPQPPPRSRGEGKVDRNIARSTAATISPPPERLIPASGVYACLAHIEPIGTYPAVANIAPPPAPESAPDTQRPVIEAHLLDCDAHLSDQVVALDFIARLRDEPPFPSHEALASQAREIIAQALRETSMRET